MAVIKSTYAPNEWRFALKAEATLGTKSTTTMQLINVDDMVTVTQDVTQTLDARSGAGRTMKFADGFTTDKGGHLTSVSISGVFDTTVGPLILSNALGTDVGTAPASYDMAYNYAPIAIGHGDVAGISKSFTFAFIPPIDAKTMLLVGCVCTDLTVTFDSSNEGGRGHFSATFETKYRPVDAQPTPTSMAAYGSTYRYLREFNTVKTIDIAGGGAADLVLNKITYNIKNNAVYSGFQGANGDPEIVQRAIPAADISLLLGVKYDTNTEMLYSTRRDGSNIAVIVSDNATWASAAIGINAPYCLIDSDVPPSGTDAGVFQDVSLKCMASTSGDIIQIVP
jgi:hypothetical protein